MAGAVKQRLHAVLFDWDGTLVDSYDADLAAYMKMFRDFGIHWGANELDARYSPDWRRIYQLAGIPQDQWERADKLWSKYYRDQKTWLIPGSRRVLQWVERRCAMGLVTSGNRRRAIRQLRELGLIRTFRVKICAEDASRRKPHPLPLLVALRRMRLHPAEAAYVGDTPEDIEMARSAGVRSIGVMGPFPTHHRLRKARPDCLLESIKELPVVLRDLADLK